MSATRSDGRSAARSVAALAAFAGATAGAAAAGASCAPAGERASARWYRGLDRPPWTPPDAAFAPAWTAMYTASVASAWRVWRAAPSRFRTAALVAWVVQLVLNGLWSPLFFGARRPRAALVDVVALDAALVAYLWAAARVDRPAAALVAPYVGWSLFATALNAEIVRRNPHA